MADVNASAGALQVQAERWCLPGVVGIVLIAACPVRFLEVEMDIFLIRQCALIPLSRKTSTVSADRFGTGFRHGQADLTPTAIDDLGASIHQGFVACIYKRVIVVRAVAVKPDDPMYILAGIKGAGVYASTGGGGSWNASVAGLEPNGSLHDIVFDPVETHKVYVSDYFSGMYVSSDGGDSWTQINDGIKNRMILALSISPDGQHVYAASNGGGICSPVSFQ